MSVTPITFLAVEDDDVDLMALKRALSEIGLANPVKHVVDGKEALDFLVEESKTKNVPEEYILFLDLNMPRMNGHEFLAAVRENPKLSDLRVLVVTTSDTDNDIVGAYSQSIEAYLLKSDLKESLREAIGEATSKWMLVS